MHWCNKQAKLAVGPPELPVSSSPPQTEKAKKEKKEKKTKPPPAPATRAVPDAGEARNRFYEDQAESVALPDADPAPEASATSRDRRIVSWAAPESDAGTDDEQPIRIWDGHLKPPAPPKDTIVVGKPKKGNPAGFAKGAAVAMSELPQFQNTKGQAISHFAVSKEKVALKDSGEQYLLTTNSRAGLPMAQSRRLT